MVNKVKNIVLKHIYNESNTFLSKNDYIINNPNDRMIGEIGDVLVNFHNLSQQKINYLSDEEVDDLIYVFLAYIYNNNIIKNVLGEYVNSKVGNKYDISDAIQKIRVLLVKRNKIRESLFIDKYPSWENVKKYVKENNIPESETAGLSSLMLEFYWKSKEDAKMDYVDIINNELKNTRQELFLDTSTPHKSKYVMTHKVHVCGCEELELIDGVFPIHLLIGKLEEKSDTLKEAVFQGKKVKLNKPKRGGSKKFYVYVNSNKKNSDGEIVAKKVSFGDKNMSIKRDNPENRKNFRSRHNCADKTDKTKAGYWSCKFWSDTPVSELVEAMSKGSLKEGDYTIDPKLSDNIKSNTKYYEGDKIRWFSKNGNLVVVKSEDIVEISSGNLTNYEKVKTYTKQIESYDDIFELTVGYAYVDEVTFNDFLAQRSGSDFNYLDGHKLTTSDLTLDEYIQMDEIDDVDGLEYVDDEVMQIMEKYRFSGAYSKFNPDIIKGELEKADEYNTNESEIETFLDLEQSLFDAIENESGDFGKLRYQLRDGHHRVLAAIECGETYIALDVVQDSMNSYREKLTVVNDIYIGENYISEEVDLTEDYPSSWSMETFLSLPNKTKRLEYAKKHLKKLGCGSSRCAFDIDGEKVLKIANKGGDVNQGTEQNNTEIDIGTTDWYSITPEIYDYDNENGLWLEMEKVIPFKSEEEFEKNTGVSIDRLTGFLKSINSSRKGNEKYDDLWDNESFYDLVQMIRGTLLPVGDFTKYNHWGLNKKGELKVLDFGLTDEIFKKYYKRH